jgi:SAM-dependent methyltransferase
MKYIYILIIIITILLISKSLNIINNFSNDIIDRSTFINKIDKNKLSLEIGALHSPIIDPNVYNNVYILDVFDTDTLRKNYENDKEVDINKIVNVDYVWSGQKYNELITDRKFDQVLSSHNIEHQPDLIKYLNNISSVLIPGGLIYFIIPDKRYCFDHFKKESDIIDILSANIRQDIKPSISNLLEWRIKNTHNNADNHWNNDHGIDKTYNSTHLISIYTELKKIYNNNNYDYIDTHVWKFIPESFIKNINLLYLMELSDLNLIFCSDTKQNSHEFYAILQKNI